MREGGAPLPQRPQQLPRHGPDAPREYAAPSTSMPSLMLARWLGCAYICSCPNCSSHLSLAMASFYAELEVGGHTYPLRTCAYGFTQGTDSRGRVNEKVRHGRVHLTLDVPEDCFLEHWGAAAHMPLAGHITFYDAIQRSALETLAWEVGHCVGYQEEFMSGDLLSGAYTCQVTIISPQLTLTPGGPSRRYVAPAPREYAYLPAQLLAPDPLTPPPLSKRQRYEVRMRLLADSQAKLDRETQRRLAALHPDTAAAADATRVAPGGRAAGALRAAGPVPRPEDLTPLQAANDRLARNNFAVEHAKLADDSYFNDLQKLPNGTYAAVRSPLKDAAGKVMLDAAGKPIPMDTPEGWIVKKIYKGEASGFMAVLYQSTYQTPPQNVLAFRGTDADPAAMAELIKDAKTDGKQGIGLYTDAFKQTKDIALRVQADDLKGQPFDICGHSLGGAEASLAALITGSNAYTFNSAGLHQFSMERAGIQPAQYAANVPKIQAYFADNDPLNWNQDNPGLVKGAAKLGVKALTWPMGPIASPVAPYIDSPLVMPQAIGTRQLLDSQTHDRLPGVDVAGHSIPPMVEAIERQKDADTARLRQFTDRPE